MKKLNLIIRGHVRNSFNNKSFYDLIKRITEDFETDIYIHTWNVVQTNLSWRGMHNDETEVNEQFLKNYFDDLWKKVKHFIIEDDKKIILHGNTEGNVGLTPCPVRAYKNMFYGKLRIAEYVFHNAPKDEIVVQTRFDVLSNSFSTDPLTIINFLHNPPETNDRIKFIRQEPILGVENTYMSSVSDLYEFISFFYYNFDEIYKRHSETRHQEHPVFFERNNF